MSTDKQVRDAGMSRVRKANDKDDPLPEGRQVLPLSVMHADRRQGSGRPHARQALDMMHERGWALVRLRPRTKEAFERGWNKLSRTPGDFLPNENVGVRFGPDSGNLIDIDLDIAEARLLVSEPVFGLSDLPEFGRASLPAGQRGHRLCISSDTSGKSRVFGFRSEEDKAALRALGIERLTVLEIRASGQTAFPPSVITLPVNGHVVPDRLVWSQLGECGVEIPEMAWADVQLHAGLLAVSAFAAAVMRAVASDPDALPTAKVIFSNLLVDAGFHDVEEIIAAVVRCIEGEAATGPATSVDVDALLGPRSRIGGILRGWVGAERDVAPHDRTTVPDHGPIAAEDIEALLAALDPCDFSSYFAWRDMLFACHHATGGSDAGREAFVEWSQGNPTYYGDHWALEVRNAWRRCSKGRSTAITAGTLFMYVDKAGHRSLRQRVMDRYGPSPAPDFDCAPLDDYGRIADAPIIPFDEHKLNAPIIDHEDH